jgi:hypothetical protein
MKGTVKKAANTTRVAKERPGGSAGPRGTAKTTEGVGALQETLKWGQPSSISRRKQKAAARSGSKVKSAPGQYAVYFHCPTNLVETFRELYPKEFSYGGNRSILLQAKSEAPEAALRHCVALALTYHLNKRKAAR